MPVTVAIVEDNNEIREGLATLIGGSPGFRCLGTFATAEEALRGIPRQRPDVVLMDIHLPGMSGIECTRRLKEQSEATQVMMLTVYEEDDQIFRSLAAGATGYVLKNTPPAEILEAIHVVQAGGSPMSEGIARKVVATFRRTGSSSSDTENLSRRELEILSHVARGFQDKEIAEKLFLSDATVRTHLRNVYKKLHVRSRTEAAMKYLGKS